MARVGDRPPKTYGGVVTAAATPYVLVRISDGLDADGQPQDCLALGAATVGALVSVQVDAGGRAILLPRS